MINFHYFKHITGLPFGARLIAWHTTKDVAAYQDGAGEEQLII